MGFVSGFQAAVSLGTHIMSDEWVHRCWELRDEYEMMSTDEHLVSVRVYDIVT